MDKYEVIIMIFEKTIGFVKELIDVPKDIIKVCKSWKPKWQLFIYFPIAVLFTSLVIVLAILLLPLIDMFEIILERQV